MKIGDIIKKLREERNWLQKDLADFLGFRNTTISEWERGKTEPDINTLKKLTKLFNVTADYLIGLTDENGNKIEEAKEYEFDYEGHGTKLHHKFKK